MKQGLTLMELATEIQRQSQAKQDYLSPAAQLSVSTVGSTPRLRVGEQGEVGINALAHRQLGEYLGIPAGFYDRILGEGGAYPEVRMGRSAMAPVSLFDVTVNTMLSQLHNDRRLVRTMDGNARAILSDRYRPMDHDEILMAMLPTFQQLDGIDWGASSMQVTDSKLYVKLVNSRVQGEVTRGDIVQAGVVLTNSETGQGSFSVQPMLYRLVCLNGMIRPEQTVRKYHTGGRLDQGEEARRYLADETLQARNRATILEMRDLVKGALSEALFEQSLRKMQEAAGVKLEKDPIKSVEVVTKRFSLTEGESGQVLQNLVNGGDLSLWGMVNAVTLAAQVVESYDRSTELEAIGGKLLESDKAQLRELVVA